MTRLGGSDLLVAELSALFGISVTQWRDLGGSRTTNLRLMGPQGDHVARVHQEHTSTDRLVAVQAARIAVADAGLPAVRPIASRTGSTIQLTSSGRLAEIEPYVAWTEQMKTPHQLRVGFAALAAIHDALHEASLPSAARTARYANHLGSADAAAATLIGAERMRSWGQSGPSRFADQVEAHIDAVVGLERLLSTAPWVQVVHGDFWDNNVLFADDRIVAILDFDFMAERARIDDLALTIYFYLLEPGHGRPGRAERELVRSLVDAYDDQTTRPLALEERLALPLAMARQPAWSVGRWIVELDEPDAMLHAAQAATEFGVAQQILAELSLWQDSLIRVTLTGTTAGADRATEC